MPSLDEVSELLTDELIYDVDYSIERLKDSTDRGLTLLFEDFDLNFRKQKLLGYLRDIKVSDYYSDRILSVRDSKSLYFRGSNSFLVEFNVRKPDLVYDLIKTLHSYLKTETRRPIKIGKVIDDRKKREHWFAVIIRNLPPKVSQKEIEEQCQRDVNGSVFVGTLLRIKERYCCVIRCDYLEDAELICKRLNDFQLKDRHTYEKYVIKAHLHPLSNFKHTRQDKSLFGDLFKMKEKANVQKSTTTTTTSQNKTKLNELLNIFVSSKKTNTSDKSHGHSHSHGHTQADPLKRRESMEEKVGHPLLGETDSLLKRIYSTQPTHPDDKQQETGPESGEIMPTSALSRLMQTSAAENLEKEANLKAAQMEREADEQADTKETVEKHEGERSKDAIEEEKPSIPEENIEKVNYHSRFETQPWRKYPDRRYESRFDNKHTTSGSRGSHDKRTSSRSPPYYKKPDRPKYVKDENPKQRKFFFHNNKVVEQEGLDERRRNEREVRDQRKDYSKPRISKSRSRSQSKSATRAHRSRHHDYKRNKYQNDSSKGSPRRSPSRNRKKRTSKSRSKSKSVSRSPSVRREKRKDSKGKKDNHVSTLFAYNAKDTNSDDVASPSPKRTKKGHHSRSKSKDRSRKNDNQASSKYYNQSRDRHKHHDYQKGSYNRRDRHDSRDKSYHKSSDRRNHHDQRHNRDYHDRDRKKHRSPEKGRYKDKNRDRSRSKMSKSKDKRSASRSVSSRSERSSKDKRRGNSIEKNTHRSPSEDKRKVIPSTLEQKINPEALAEKVEMSNGSQGKKD